MPCFNSGGFSIYCPLKLTSFLIGNTLKGENILSFDSILFEDLISSKLKHILRFIYRHMYQNTNDVLLRCWIQFYISRSHILAISVYTTKSAAKNKCFTVLHGKNVLFLTNWSMVFHKWHVCEQSRVWWDAKTST